MDWELNERYRATVALIGAAFISLLLLAFQQTTAVRYLKTILVHGTFPIEQALGRLTTSADAPPAGPNAPPKTDDPPNPALVAALPAEQMRLLHLLKEENVRLRRSLDLKEHRWPDR